jgi:hypothetical protein
MRALSSLIASGRAEVNSIGQRENLPEEIKEEVMEGLQTMGGIHIQKGGELLMSKVPASWRDRFAQRI